MQTYWRWLIKEPLSIKKAFVYLTLKNTTEILHSMLDSLTTHSTRFMFVNASVKTISMAINPWNATNKIYPLSTFFIPSSNNCTTLSLELRPSSGCVLWCMGRTCCFHIQGNPESKGQFPPKFYHRRRKALLLSTIKISNLNCAVIFRDIETV